MGITTTQSTQAAQRVMLVAMPSARSALSVLLLLPLSLSLSIPPRAPRSHLRCHCSCHSVLRMCSFDESNDIENTLRASLSSQSMRAARFGEASELLRARDDVWVLLFNPERHNEGVYTLQGRTDARTYIVSFEHGDEAERFAHLLHAEGFDMASPRQWSANQVSTFCTTAGFDLSFVPEGALLLPPSHNVYDTEAFEELDKIREGNDEASKHEPPEDITRARDILERLWDEPST